MDLKAISWVGNIYQKFETMCLEMEEAMYQDTVKYVKNQVNTVGTSVKKFYSEVMQDIHPHYSIDPVKVAAADLSLNPYAHDEIDKKLRANPKGSTRGFSNKLNDDTQVIKGKSKSGGVYKRQNVGIKEIAADSHPSKKSNAICLASGDAIKLSSSAVVRSDFEVASDSVSKTSALATVKGSDSGEAASKVCDQIVESYVPAAGSPINSAASVMTLPVEFVRQNQADSRISSSVDTCTKQLACNTRSEISTNTWNNGFSAEGINESFEERSDNLPSAKSNKYGIIESEAEIVEKVDEYQFEEEACVLVEGERIHVPQGIVKQKSYKKKLREAFSTKKRLTRKEYEQLGTLYGDQHFNVEAEGKVMPVLAINSNTNKLSANDHPESEWEIL